MASDTAAVGRRGLPVIDLSGVDLAGSAGEPAWDAVREQVMQALVSYGCFEAVYDRVDPELRGWVLRTAATDLFALPLETKLKNAADSPFDGYLGQIPGLDYESLAIMDANLPHAVRSFAGLMWPDGNPEFSEKACSYAMKLAELEVMVRRMVLESLGVAKYLAEQSADTWYLLRFAEYGGAAGEGGKEKEEEKEKKKEEEEEEEEGKAWYEAHRDTNILGIICQLNGVDGLQVETRDGEWLLVKPTSPSSFFITAGDAFRAWSNGRVHAPMHRVVVGGKHKRYSAILFSIPKHEQVIKAPAELVDATHPSLFNPYVYDAFVRFSVSEESLKHKCKLTGYCGRVTSATAT